MRNVVAMILILAAAPAVWAEMVSFDHLPTGEPPPGWTATQTGKGRARWTVEADASAPSRPNVLKQSGEASYPLCLKRDTHLQDGFVDVKFKPVGGQEDRAGGLVWRAKDADNYYVARANALEDNVTIYHTLNGRRVAFKNTNTRVTSGKWHTLRVDFEGNHFTVTFDGTTILEATDDSISAPGQVGLWTKADSVTLFDEFQYGSKRSPVSRTTR